MGAVIFLLNPDTALLNNVVAILYRKVSENSSVGMAGGELFTREGKPNISFGTFPGLRNTICYDILPRNTAVISSRDRKKERDRVDFSIGADFMFRRKLVDEVGSMGERYFIYFDETDFARDITRKGYKGYIFPEAKIVHLQGQSAKTGSTFASEQFFKSHVRYMIKNVSLIERLVMLVVETAYLKIRLSSLILLFPMRKESIGSLKSRIAYLKKLHNATSHSTLGHFDGNIE